MDECSFPEIPETLEKYNFCYYENFLKTLEPLLERYVQAKVVQAGLAISSLGIRSFDYSRTQKPQIRQEKSAISA